MVDRTYLAVLYLVQQNNEHYLHFQIFIIKYLKLKIEDKDLIINNRQLYFQFKSNK